MRSSLQHVRVLVVTCGIWFPHQESNLESLHWKCGVLATGPSGKSQDKQVFKHSDQVREQETLKHEGLQFWFLWYSRGRNCEFGYHFLVPCGPYQRLLIFVPLTISILTSGKCISLWFWFPVLWRCQTSFHEPVDCWEPAHEIPPMTRLWEDLTSKADQDFRDFKKLPRRSP